LIGGDTGINPIRFATAYDDVATIEFGSSVSDGLHFVTRQNDASFESVEDFEIEVNASVGEEGGHGEGVATIAKNSPFSCISV
jgi:hypothetical protein